MVAIDDFKGKGKERISDPVDNAFAITPDNDNDLDHVTRGIYVGVSGDLKVDLNSGDTAVFKDIAAGIIHPLRVKKVYATGTDATDIVGVY